MAKKHVTNKKHAKWGKPVNKQKRAKWKRVTNI